MEVAKFLMDDVYTCMCHLEDPNSIFAVDFFYHRNCFPEYIFKYKTAKKESQNLIKDKETEDLITGILNKGRDISISDLCDMINDDNPEIDMKNNKLKALMEEKFGNNIQFCLSESKNKSVCIFLTCECK